MVDHLLVRQRDYRDLFTTRDTFLSPSLAVLYGVPAPPGWTPYTSPADSQRVGLLTQVSFLAAHAHPGRSSVTLRGKALREKLLCQQVPRPPPVRSPASASASSAASPLPSTPSVPAEENVVVLETYKAVVGAWRADTSVLRA